MFKELFSRRESSQELQQRRNQAQLASEAVKHMPISDVEIMMGIDHYPIFDKYGKQHPSLAQERERSRKSEEHISDVLAVHELEKIDGPLPSTLWEKVKFKFS